MTLNFPRARVVTFSILLIPVLSVAGCSVFGGGGDNADRSATADRLTVPPDLSRERIGEVPELGSRRSTTLSEFAGGGGRTPSLLPEPPGMTMQRQGADRWLRIEATPEQVWTWLNAFLEQNEVAVVRRSQPLGVIETDWLPRPLGVSGGVFLPLPADSGSAVREQYVFRLEPGLSGGTELFVTNRRAAQVREDDGFRWEPRDSERGREAEALRSFMVFVGLSEAAAVRAGGAAETAAELTRLETAEDGTVSLLINESYLQGWRRTGLALDRAGFTVEDRDRSAGRYVVRYDPGADSERREPGVLSWLAFWRDDEPALEPGNYVIRTRSDSGSTRLTVEDEDGNPVSRALAERLLVLIDEQLR